MIVLLTMDVTYTGAGFASSSDLYNVNWLTSLTAVGPNGGSYWGKCCVLCDQVTPGTDSFNQFPEPNCNYTVNTCFRVLEEDAGQLQLEIGTCGTLIGIDTAWVQLGEGEAVAETASPSVASTPSGQPCLSRLCASDYNGTEDELLRHLDAPLPYDTACVHHHRAGIRVGVPTLRASRG